MLGLEGSRNYAFKPQELFVVTQMMGRTISCLKETVVESGLCGVVDMLYWDMDVEFFSSKMLS